MIWFLFDTVLPLASLATTLVFLWGVAHELRNFWRVRRARSLVGAVLIALLALGMARFGYGVSPLADSSVLRERTLLPLPLWPRQLFYYDNAEHVIRAHLVLSPQQALKLQAGEPIPVESAQETLRWFEADTDIPEAVRTLQPGAKLQRFCHCEPGSDAVSTLDTVHGDLWIVVTYTDWSGDNPGCSC